MIQVSERRPPHPHARRRSVSAGFRAGSLKQGVGPGRGVLCTAVGLVAPMWWCIRKWSRTSCLCLVTSSVMAAELGEQRCRNLDVWQRGVDTMTFNPQFKSAEMAVGALAAAAGRERTSVQQSAFSSNRRRSSPCGG